MDQSNHVHLTFFFLYTEIRDEAFMGLHQNSPRGLWFNALIHSASLSAQSPATHEAYPLRRIVLLLVYPNTKYPWTFITMWGLKFLLSSLSLPFSSDGQTSHLSLPRPFLPACACYPSSLPLSQGLSPSLSSQRKKEDKKKLLQALPGSALWSGLGSPHRI